MFWTIGAAFVCSGPGAGANASCPADAACPHRPRCHAGVPCLTLAGSCHAHNVGVSLLTAVGLQLDWVAHSGGPGPGNRTFCIELSCNRRPALYCMSQQAPGCKVGTYLASTLDFSLALPACS